jgi:hypothetical protein
MSQQKTSETGDGDKGSDGSSTGIVGFVEAWESPRNPFDKYVRNVSKAYFETRLDIESAAGWVKASPAEVAALLRLAEMSDEDLAMISKIVPPKTTWFTLAEASSDGVRAGLDALQAKKSKRTAFARVMRAIKQVVGPSSSEKVGQLSGDILVKMGKKADKYNALNKKARGALVSLGYNKNSYGRLTIKQVAFATKLLTELADAGVIRRDSQDGDVRECKAVLDALDR